MPKTWLVRGRAGGGDVAGVQLIKSNCCWPFRVFFSIVLFCLRIIGKSLLRVCSHSSSSYANPRTKASCNSISLLGGVLSPYFYSNCSCRT